MVACRKSWIAVAEIFIKKSYFTISFIDSLRINSQIRPQVYCNLNPTTDIT